MNYVTMAAVCCLACVQVMAQGRENEITGKWMYAEKNLVVDVYKKGSAFEASIVWFHDPRDTITPLDERLDVKNPNAALRTRKVIGMDILSNLAYDPQQNKWIKGKIYDSSSGRTWDATVWLTDANTMQVRGYYIFKFLGRTMKFTRL